MPPGYTLRHPPLQVKQWQLTRSLDRHANHSRGAERQARPPAPKRAAQNLRVPPCAQAVAMGTQVHAPDPQHVGSCQFTSAYLGPARPNYAGKVLILLATAMLWELRQREICKLTWHCLCEQVSASTAPSALPAAPRTPSSWRIQVWPKQGQGQQRVNAVTRGRAEPALRCACFPYSHSAQSMEKNTGSLAALVAAKTELGHGRSNAVGRPRMGLEFVPHAHPHPLSLPY